jgi:hypothetical protein
MDYEKGLEQLKRLAKGTDWYQDMLIYEARLRENLQEEGRYGTTQQIRATRAQIVDQLNRLAGEHLGMSFNELCLGQAQQQSGTTSSQSEYHPQGLRSKVYISYSPEDRQFLDELHKHLDYFAHTGALDYWDDTKILAGSRRQEELHRALQRARVAILLASPDFFASDSIAHNELPELLQLAEQDEIRILSVILRPCAYKDSPFAQFSPVNERPLSGLDKSKRAEIWNNVVQLVRDGTAQ